MHVVVKLLNNEAIIVIMIMLVQLLHIIANHSCKVSKNIYVLSTFVYHNQMIQFIMYK
jgi:hypothetical protein